MDQQASLQNQALELLDVAVDMENRGCSISEIEAKIAQANKLVEESSKLQAPIQKQFRRKIIFMRVMVFLPVVIAVFAALFFW